MPIKQNMDIKSELASGRQIKIDLGCGESKRAGHIGLDRLDLPGVDVVGNLAEALVIFPDNSVDAVYSKSVLEHVDDLDSVMDQLIRVMKPEAEAYIFVPHWSNPYYYQDYTHTRFFGLYTFYYFASPENQHPSRSMLSFYRESRIKVLDVKLILKSNFAWLRPFRKIATAIINSSATMQAFYEENMTYGMPCYGVEVVFRPDK